MGWLKRVGSNIKAEISYRNMDNALGKAIFNHELDKCVKNNPINKKHESCESAYEIERKAEKINGDANYILYKTEERIDVARKKIVKEIEDIRKREWDFIVKIGARTWVDENKAKTADNEFYTSIQRPAFYAEYDNEPFTLKGLFVRSYSDAEREAERALMIAKSNKAQANAVSARVDLLLKDFEIIHQMIYNENKILDNFEIAILEAKKQSSTLKMWLKELIYSSIANGEYKINEEHKNALDKIARYIEK